MLIKLKYFHANGFVKINYKHIYYFHCILDNISVMYTKKIKILFYFIQFSYTNIIPYA